jgi:hypothetical protein
MMKQTASRFPGCCSSPSKTTVHLQRPFTILPADDCCCINYFPSADSPQAMFTWMMTEGVD